MAIPLAQSADEVFELLGPLRTAPIDDLRDPRFVADLIVEMGLCDLFPDLYPGRLRARMGGLRTAQVPDQMAAWLVWLSERRIRRYLEIGALFGGCLIVTAEYLRRFNPLERVVAVDPLFSQTLWSYRELNPAFMYAVTGVESITPALLTGGSEFDVAFIDGDHSDAGVRRDFSIARSIARIVAFHDCVDAMATPEVAAFWTELSSDAPEQTVLFDAQIEELVPVTGRRYCGIGAWMREG